MWKLIDFENTKPDFNNGVTMWYVDPYFKMILENQQKVNLPKLENHMVFVVKGENISDLVLINDKQQVIKSYENFNQNNIEAMECFINVLKISKHYNETENI
jgi:hypothetical protein